MTATLRMTAAKLSSKRIVTSRCPPMGTRDRVCSERVNRAKKEKPGTLPDEREEYPNDRTKASENSRISFDPDWTSTGLKGSRQLFWNF